MVFLTPFWLKTTVVINWVINNDFIANTFCEKKYDYLNDCQGVCYVNKQLNTIDSQLSKNQPAKQSSSLIVVENIGPYYLFDNFKLSFYSHKEIKSLRVIELTPITFNPTKDIFHPPRFV
jgi:hypothetical protein